jgi:hypothetical protein
LFIAFALAAGFAASPARPMRAPEQLINELTLNPDT